jgi:hypothetical protein
MVVLLAQERVQAQDLRQVVVLVLPQDQGQAKGMRQVCDYGCERWYVVYL